MDAPDLHPLNAALIPLLGNWQGTGEGNYPTIPSFGFGEELRFGHVGKPFVAMTQRTRQRESGLPMHAESGYLRPQPMGAVEFVLSQPSGIVEIHTGTITETEVGVDVDLHSEAVHVSPAAKLVRETRRRYVVEGDTLTSDFWMAAMGEPLTHHLHSELTRQL
ncbi:MAG: FABP family protein [Actinomycetota bacterium]